MSTNPSPPDRLHPDDALPPVEPPSAGFIVQLFVVPGVIVVAVVMVWVLFNWLAQKGNDADAYVRALKRNNDARWQAAFNLALELAAERQREPELTVNPELARQLAGILEGEMETGSMEQHPVALRIYLARALGEFRVSDGLPVLIKAAETQRDDAEAEVRQAALEAIAIGASQGPKDDYANNPRLQEALLKAADAEPRTQVAAITAMGVIGDEVYRERMRAMLGSLNPDVRYNAALRLAHLGDAASVDVLAEMLDPEEEAGLKTELEKSARPFKREVILRNALQATGDLARANADADLAPLQAAVKALSDNENIPTEARLQATAIDRQLTERAAAS